MSEKNSIGVLGRWEEVLAFQAAGFRMYPVESQPEVLHMFRKAAEECVIVFIVPEFAAMLTEEIGRYDAVPTPSVSILPEKHGDTGMAFLRRMAERAVGSDILFRDGI